MQHEATAAIDAKAANERATAPRAEELRAAAEAEAEAAAKDEEEQQAKRNARGERDGTRNATRTCAKSKSSTPAREKLSCYSSS